MDAFHVELSEAQNAVGNALIEATPEDWPEATVEVDNFEREGTFACAIGPPPGRSPDVEVTKPLGEAILALLEVYRRHGKAPWKRMVLHVRQGAGDSWRFEVNYSYE